MRRSQYGKCHDLAEYMEDLQEEYFDHKDLGLTVSWGRWPRAGSSNIRMGAYYSGPNLIVISPVLDCKTVPRYFVKYILFHEMLHSVVPWEHPVGEPHKVILHTETFKQEEAKYKYFTKSLRWEEDNVDKLFRKKPSK
jgi:hypothetical protein